MVKTCDNCGNPFEAQRETAKYCSDKCRKASSRVTVTSENDVTLREEVNVTLKTDPVRGRLIELFREEGKTEPEIDSIMTHQERYHENRGIYFIPARFTRLI